MIENFEVGKKYTFDYDRYKENIYMHNKRGNRIACYYPFRKGQSLKCIEFKRFYNSQNFVRFEGNFGEKLETIWIKSFMLGFFTESIKTSCIQEEIDV